MKRKLTIFVLAIVGILACALGLVACDSNGEHTHFWSGWSSDGETTHSRTCICGETETQNHTVVDGVCTVCGYEATPAHVHSWSEWTSDGGILYNKEKTDIITVPRGITGEITLPDTVVYIRGYAFYNCVNITKITVSNYLEYIGDHAFYGCENTLTLNTDGSGSYIGSASNPYLVLVKGTLGTVINSNTRFIYQRAFSNSGVTSVTIPESVKGIGSEVFYGCNNLTSIEFDEADGWQHSERSPESETAPVWIGINLGNPTYNATYFKSTYMTHYWRCVDVNA